MPGYTLDIGKKTKLHKRVLKEVVDRIQLAEKHHENQRGKWEDADRLTLAYLPETEVDSKRRERREDGKPDYTTISIPYSYALLMAAHTYWTSVFFARNPVHQFAGRHGEGEQSIQALEAIISYQVEIGGALPIYYRWLYDCGKYGTGILGEYWEVEKNRYTQLEPLPDGTAQYITKETLGYVGNRIYNIPPWDFLPDPRVSVSEFQKGEFCIAVRRLSWNELIRRERAGYYVNLEEIKGPIVRKGYRSDSLNRNWDYQTPMIGSEEKKHPAWIDAYEVYVELIPEEWELGKMDYPEKWVFTVTADKALIIGAQPLGLLHCKYPFSVIELEFDAYQPWSRSIPEIMEPVQNTMDWLINSHFWNVRATNNGRFIGDPSAIFLKDLEKNEPGFVLQVKPEAYGRDVRTMFQQLQTVDPTVNHFNDFRNMLGVGERIIGINDQILGALTGGGRKTATEIRTSTGFGTNRLKTTSEYMSAEGFAPHAQRLVQNTQQLYTAEQKFKIAGDLINTAGPRFIDVTPDAIAGAYDFVPIDGTLPVDRFAQATLWKDLMMQMARMPQLMMQFDIGRIFTWVASLAGAKNIQQFRVQVRPDQQLAAQAAAGNVIPMSRGEAPQSNVAVNPTESVGG